MKLSQQNSRIKVGAILSTEISENLRVRLRYAIAYKQFHDDLASDMFSVELLQRTIKVNTPASERKELEALFEILGDCTHFILT